MAEEIKFEAISPSDFFYRNRDIAGFSSPSRALYMSIRELIENSLDACESARILPIISVELSKVDGSGGSSDIYHLRVQDNGVGVDAEYIPQAFATVLYGSKYGHRQSRGTFGLGGTMALLYGQITTNSPFRVVSSTGSWLHEFSLMIDIVENKPRVFDHKRHRNADKWRGTTIEFLLEADYRKAKGKIIDYLRETAVANPQATLSFIDPRGRLYMYENVIKILPEPPEESLPHPQGVDVETMARLLSETDSRTLSSFLSSSFQRMGSTTAKNILRSANLPFTASPKQLAHDDVTQLVTALKNYKRFRVPDASSLSPIGKEVLKAGMMREFRPDFMEVVQRKPSSYGGFPFIIEAGVAYGGEIPVGEGFQLYRFANKIPLLYDERADVSWKVISNIDWSNYRVSRGAPVAIVTHLCSTKIPYKTVGKEAIADRPQIERELTIAIREAARGLKRYLGRIERKEAKKRRLTVFARYLPKIARFSAKLAKRRKPPDVKPLLRKLGLEPEVSSKKRRTK